MPAGSPDAFIVEKEVRRSRPVSGAAAHMGLPVQEYTPHRGAVETSWRVSTVRGGHHCLGTSLGAADRRWAEEVVEEIAGISVCDHTMTTSTPQ
jgi:hypothetical protein